MAKDYRTDFAEECYGGRVAGKRKRRCRFLREPLNAALLRRQVGEADKAVTSHRTPKPSRVEKIRTHCGAERRSVAVAPRRLRRYIVWLLPLWFAAFTLRAATNSANEDELLKLIPPQAELPPSFWEQYGSWVGLAAVVLVVLVGAAVWWMLRPKPSIPVPIEVLSRKELEALSQRSEDGRVLSQVSRVLRRYVGGAFELPADELTTSEFCRVMAAHERIGPELAARVGEFLRRCDELKFARAGSPSPMDAAARALELVELGEARRAHLRTSEAEAAVRPATRTSTDPRG